MQARRVSHVLDDLPSTSTGGGEWRRAVLSRISRLLHDEVGPTLTAVGFHLHLAEQDPESLRAAASSVDLSITSLRRLSYLSHPEVAARFGIVRAFELLSDCVAPDFRGTVRLRMEGEPSVTGPEAQAWFEDAAQAMVAATNRDPQGRFVAVLASDGWTIKTEE